VLAPVRESRSLDDAAVPVPPTACEDAMMATAHNTCSAKEQRCRNLALTTIGTVMRTVVVQHRNGDIVFFVLCKV